jgi:hypothetical protein
MGPSVNSNCAIQIINCSLLFFIFYGSLIGYKEVSQNTQRHIGKTAKAITIMNPHEEDDIETALANQLTALSLNDRNKIQEEIHCVISLAVQETSAMVEDALEQLRQEASSLVGSDGGNIYVVALIGGSPYVQSRHFGLKFLRAEFFNVKLAARRMLNHLELLFKFYGSFALQRPLRFLDLTAEEENCIRKGPLQILPSRDKAGRLVHVFQGSMENVTQFQRVCYRFGINLIHSILVDNGVTFVLTFAFRIFNVSVVRTR